MTIISNQIKCLKCGDTPFSAHVHDFKYCECGAVAIDGGCDYLKRMGSPDNLQELGIIVDRKALDTIIQLTQEVIDAGRNARGIVYTVFRGIRDTNIKEQDNIWSVEE